MYKDCCQECYWKDAPAINRYCSTCVFPDDGFYSEGSNFRKEHELPIKCVNKKDYLTQTERE